MMVDDPTTPVPNGDDFFDAMCEQILATPMPTRRRWDLRRHRPRPRPITWKVPVLGGGMALAAAAVALVVALGAGGGAPQQAYGVTFNHHTVTIDWREWKEVRQLNVRLAVLQMRIRVVPIVRGCVAPTRRVIYRQADSNVPTHVARGPARTLEVPAPPITGGASESSGSGQGATLTTWNDTLPGRTRIFVVSRAGWAGDVFTVVGSAPRCVGEAAPAGRH